MFFAALAVFGGALAVAIKLDSATLIIGVVATFILCGVLLSLVGSALTAIYTAAVYRYATEGDAGALFAPELVRGAFRAT